MSERDEKWTPFGLELRRLILAKFKSIRAFSQASGVPENTVHNWSVKSIPDPSVPLLVKAADALEIEFGKLCELVAQQIREASAPPGTRSAALTDEQIKRALFERSASIELIGAWDEWFESRAARWFTITASFLDAFLDELSRALASGAKRDAALERAVNAGQRAARADQAADAIANNTAATQTQPKRPRR